MKICKKCNKEKSDEEFSKKTKTTLHSYCKECQNLYNREHYNLNKHKHNKRRLKNINLTKVKHSKKLRELKNNPCKDCGKIYPHYVMEFDHLKDKIANISNMPGRFSWDKIQEELDKCELVCANCHRIRTFSRKESKD